MGRIVVDLKDILIIALVLFIVIAILNGVLALFAIAIRLLISLMYLVLIAVVIGAVVLLIKNILK